MNAPSPITAGAIEAIDTATSDTPACVARLPNVTPSASGIASTR